VSFARSADTLVLGSARNLSVTLRDASGRTVSARDVQWASSAPTVATATPDHSRSDAQGIATIAVQGLAIGSTTLTATSEHQAATISLAVVPAPVRRVQLQLPAPPLFPGDTGTVTAIAFDSAGTRLTSRTTAWAVSPSSVASITPAGLLTVLTTGTATITATVEGVRDSATLIIRGERVATVQLWPREMTLAPGQKLAIRTRLTGTSGATLADRTPRFVSSNPAVASVASDGIVTTVAPGVATITASSGGQAAMLPLTILAPTPSAFTIDVRFIGTPAPAVEVAARLAAARWSRVIIGALPPTWVDLPANTCTFGTPAITGTIRNVVIRVKVDSIDGLSKFLARAGPCVLRQTGTLPSGYPEWGLPLLGDVTLDGADVEWIQANDMLADVLLHEMGHVLGIGTLWNIYDQWIFVPPVDDGDPRHIGLHTATSAYRLGFTDDPQAGAHVEALGGAGTAGRHWRESVMQKEVMTGWIGGPPNPLSPLTVETLRDLGYEVDPAGADAFSMANTFIYGFPLPPNLSTDVSARGVGGARPSTNRLTPVPLEERLIVPRFGIDPRGRVTPLVPPR
jgi:uncharacterized protein YjdB